MKWGLEKKNKKDNILSLFDFVRNIQINEMEEIFERGKKRNFMARERERAKILRARKHIFKKV